MAAHVRQAEPPGRRRDGGGTAQQDTAAAHPDRRVGLAVAVDLRPGPGRPGGGPAPVPAAVDQSAKLAPKYGVPVVETPEVLGETMREPVVVIFLPSEGR
ncbi:hypothetical protein GCM10010260_48000 [Streptomyces filipinensis]|uniref:Uncharacterized protein n=1 Tax=Streptomyces filipinensis TaxID=66887 RepID=A0A918IF60_9ACTN|nr:hypothetical protein GCM10010260_48000 [Streptomyces filipinensis]